MRAVHAGDTRPVLLADVGRVQKRYMRYDIVSGGGNNPGGMEIAFYAPLPLATSRSGTTIMVHGARR